MAASEGWWVQASTGKAIEVSDHASEVENFPKKFGLKPKDVAGLRSSHPDDYNVLRLLAMRQGWVRVRSTRAGEVAVEFAMSPAEDAILPTVEFLRKKGFGPLTSVYFNDLKKRRTYQAPLADYLPGAEPASASFSVYDCQKLDALEARLLMLEQHETVRQTAARFLLDHKE
jgi:hypothetical protein